MNDCVLIYLRRVSNGFTITAVPEHEPRKVQRYVAHTGSIYDRDGVAQIISRITDTLEVESGEND